jgi:hypothetical protein
MADIRLGVPEAEPHVLRSLELRHAECPTNQPRRRTRGRGALLESLPSPHVDAFAGRCPAVMPHHDITVRHVDVTWPAPGPLGQGRMNRSTALAKPSSSFVVVTQRAARLTSSLALPIAMLSPDWANMRTSLGMSPIVAISSGAMS